MPMTIERSERKAAVGRQKNEPDLSTYSGKLGHRIETLRIAHDWSVKELAGKLDKAAVTIYAWERGDIQIPINELPRIAQVFGLTVGQLLPRA